MSAARSLAFIASIALSFSCGGGSAKLAGEDCVASSECAPGLLCDRGGTNKCAGMGTVGDAPAAIDSPATDDATPPPIDGPMIDAPPPIDAPMIDAPEIDAPDIDAPA